MWYGDLIVSLPSFYKMKIAGPLFPFVFFFQLLQGFLFVSFVWHLCFFFCWSNLRVRSMHFVVVIRVDYVKSRIDDTSLVSPEVNTHNESSTHHWKTGKEILFRTKNFNMFGLMEADFLDDVRRMNKRQVNTNYLSIAFHMLQNVLTMHEHLECWGSETPNICECLNDTRVQGSCLM